MKKSKSKKDYEDYESPYFDPGKPYALYRELDQIAAELRARTFRPDKDEEIRQERLKKRQQKLWEKTKLYRDVELEDPDPREAALNARIGAMYGAFMPNFNSCTNNAFAKPPCTFDMPFLYETEEQEIRRKTKEDFGLPEEDQDDLEPSQIPYESIFIHRYVEENFGKFPKVKLPTSSREKVKLDNLPQTGEWLRPLQLYGPITASENHHGKPRIVKRVIGYREIMKKRAKIKELKSIERRYPRTRKQKVKLPCKDSVVINIENDALVTIQEENEESECTDSSLIAESEPIELSWDDEASLSDSWIDLPSSFSDDSDSEDSEGSSEEGSWNKLEVPEVENESQPHPTPAPAPASQSESFEEMEEVIVHKESTPSSSTSTTTLDSEEELNRELELFMSNVIPFRWPWQYGSPIPVGGMLPAKSKKKDKKKEPVYPPAPWGEVFNSPHVQNPQKFRIMKKRSRDGPELPDASNIVGAKDKELKSRNKKHRKLHKQVKSSSTNSNDDNPRKERRNRRQKTLKPETAVSSKTKRKSIVTATTSKGSSTKKPSYYKKQITTTKTYYYAPTSGLESSGQDKRKKSVLPITPKKKVKVIGSSKPTTKHPEAKKTSSHSIRVLVKKRSSIIKGIQSSNVIQRFKKSQAKFESKLKDNQSGNANNVPWASKSKNDSIPWYLQKLDSALEKTLIKKQIIQKPPKRIQPITLPHTSGSSGLNSEFETEFPSPVPKATESEKQLLENLDERPLGKTRFGIKGQEYSKKDKYSVDLKVYEVETKQSGAIPPKQEDVPKPNIEPEKSLNQTGYIKQKRKIKIAMVEKDNEWLVLSDTDHELATALEAETLDKEYLNWMNPLLSYESQNMRRAMALYNMLAKVTWRQPITNNDAEDYKLVYYSVDRKRQLPFIVTSMIMFGAMVGMIQSFVDISIQKSEDVYGDIERIELDRYRIFAAFIFINLIIVSMWGIAIILHDGYSIAQYLNYMAGSLTKIESSAIKGVQSTIRRNLIIFVVYAGITSLAFLSNTPSTIRGTCGFVANLFCRSILYQYRPKKEEDLILVQIAGFAIHLYVMFCVRLMVTFLQVIAVILRNAARFWNFKFGLCFAQFGTEERGQLYRLKWAQSQRKLFQEHRLINGLSRRYGYTFSVGLFAYFVLQLSLLALVLVLMFFDDEARHHEDPESEYEQSIRSSGYDIQIRNTVLDDALTNMFVAFYTLGDFLMVTHVIANAGKAVMDGYEFVRREGLIRCDTSHERRLVMSLQWSFSARNPPLISIRNFFHIDRKGILGGISFMIMIVSLIIQLKQTTNINVIVKRPCNFTYEGYWAEQALSRDMKWCHFKISVPSGEAEQYYLTQKKKNDARVTTTASPRSTIYFMLENCNSNYSITYEIPKDKANDYAKIDSNNTLSCISSTCTITPKIVDGYNCPMEKAYYKLHIEKNISSTELPICYATIPTNHISYLNKINKRFLTSSEWKDILDLWHLDCNETSVCLENINCVRDHYSPGEFTGNCVQENAVGSESATFDWKGLLKYYYQPCWSPVLGKYILLQQVRICAKDNCPWIPLRDARLKEFQHWVDAGIIKPENATDLKAKYMDCGLNPYPRIDYLYWNINNGPRTTFVPLTSSEWNKKGEEEKKNYELGRVFVNCANIESSVADDRDDCNWQGLRTQFFFDQPDGSASEHTIFNKPKLKNKTYTFNEGDFILIPSKIAPIDKPETNPNLICNDADKKCDDQLYCFDDHIDRCDNSEVRSFCAPLLKPVKAYLYGDDCTTFFTDSKSTSTESFFRSQSSGIQNSLGLKTSERSWKFVDATKGTTNNECDYCARQRLEVKSQNKDWTSPNDWCQIFKDIVPQCSKDICNTDDFKKKSELSSGCYCEKESSCPVKHCTGFPTIASDGKVFVERVDSANGSQTAVFLLGESLSPIGLAKAQPADELIHKHEAPYICSGFVNKYDLLRYEVISEDHYQKAKKRWLLPDPGLGDFYNYPEKYVWTKSIPAGSSDASSNFKEVCENLGNFIPKTLTNPPNADQLFFHHARIFREPCRETKAFDSRIISLIQVIGVEAKKLDTDPGFGLIKFHDAYKSRTGSCLDSPYPFWKTMDSNTSKGPGGETYYACRFVNNAWKAVELKYTDFDECGTLRQPEYEKDHNTDIKNHCELSYVIDQTKGLTVEKEETQNDDNPNGDVYKNLRALQIRRGVAEGNEYQVVRKCWNLHFAQARCRNEKTYCTKDDDFVAEIFFFYKFKNLTCKDEKFNFIDDKENSISKYDSRHAERTITEAPIVRQSIDRNVLLKTDNEKTKDEDSKYWELLNKHKERFCPIFANPSELELKFCTASPEHQEVCQYKFNLEEFWGIAGIWDHEKFSPPLHKLCPTLKKNDFMLYLAEQLHPCENDKNNKNMHFEPTLQIYVNTISKKGKLITKTMFDALCKNQYELPKDEDREEIPQDGYIPWMKLDFKDGIFEPAPYNITTTLLDKTETVHQLSLQEVEKFNFIKP